MRVHNALIFSARFSVRLLRYLLFAARKKKKQVHGFAKLPYNISAYMMRTVSHVENNSIQTRARARQANGNVCQFSR